MDAAAGRYALADGATESCFAGLWAKLLVEGFVHQGAGERRAMAEVASGRQAQWDANVRGRTLPWYAEPGVRQGAFAAFLGIVLARPSPASREWQAVAVGDTCLLHTRGRTLLRAFPIGHSRQFNNAPNLVGARMTPERVLEMESLWIEGRGKPGDRLWAMTDALASWYLAEHEAGGNPWSHLESLLSSPDGQQFAEWIEGLRDAGRLRNDDVTLLAIRL